MRALRAERMEVGTSGFIGSKADWLAMPDVTCLEVNSTFYRLPTERSLKSLLELSETPGHTSLVYAVKVSKYVTHMKRLKDCREPFAAFWNAVKGLGGRLTVLLFQMPPSFKFNEQNMARLRAMTYLPGTNAAGGKLEIVFEFRDNSWFRPEVAKLCKAKGWTMGGTLIKRKPGQYWMGDMPDGLHLPERTSNCTYLRIHGGRGYRGGYGPKELERIKRSVLAKKTPINYVIFNNVFFDNRKKTCK